MNGKWEMSGAVYMHVVVDDQLLNVLLSLSFSL